MLFEPLTIKGVELKNRVVASPMCQYSAIEGLSQKWHDVHYGQLALGGAGLVFVEATAVSSEGRITNGCLGLWSNKHAMKLKEVVKSIEVSGSVPGIQLGHAGQKASMQRPWHGNGPQTKEDKFRGDKIWRPTAPTSKPLDEGWLKPKAMGQTELSRVCKCFVAASKRAVEIGFKVIEVHMAHGYLLHSFLSPLSNTREDDYGGSLEKRMKYPLSVIQAIKGVIPDDFPLFVRISAVDGFEGGWQMSDSIQLANQLKRLGVDVIDCSSGGNSSKGATNSGSKRYSGFQVPYSHEIKSKVGVKTQAVGLIRDYEYANSILVEEKADLVALGRQHLFDPYWTNHAREHFNKTAAFSDWPEQYSWWLNNWKKALSDINEKP